MGLCIALSTSRIWARIETPDRVEVSGVLVVVRTVNDNVVARLFDVYAESMGDLSCDFSSEEEMRASYCEFLEGFIADPAHLVLVEEDDGVWKSGLRAVSCGDECWFVEAVETDPGVRRQGYGKLLLLHAIEYLRSLGVHAISCCISESNNASRRLHELCGFSATGEDPINPWGELEEGCVLYRVEL